MTALFEHAIWADERLFENGRVGIGRNGNLLDRAEPRGDVADWLALNCAGRWRAPVIIRTPPEPVLIQFTDQTDAALFRLSWL